MKLNNTQTLNRKAGMTLLELTVVILVLLSLISILFVGARAWKKGSDRSANIMNARNIQQAVRGHQNMRNMDFGDTLASTVIVSADGTTGYLKEPTPPAGLADYTYLGTVPNQGTLYVTNAHLIGEYGFDAATDYADW